MMDSHLAGFDWERFIEVATPHFNGDRHRAERFLPTLEGEAKLGLKLIEPHLRPGMRVLEVGAGMGLLSSYLQTLNVDITALEPGLGGFGVSTALPTAVNFTNLRRLDIPAQDLESQPYDLIYSINVLELIPDLRGALQGMKRVMAGDGKMIHTCPNYLVPFEPHFDIPLIPLVPRLTAMFVPRLKVSELWKSRNFVTVPQVSSMARSLGQETEFKQGVLHEAFRRLETDAAFRERQSRGLVKKFYTLLRDTGT